MFTDVYYRQIASIIVSTFAPVIALARLQDIVITIKLQLNMGRTKATKIEGKFYLRTDRNPDKNGKYAIYLDYVLGTKHARTDTEVWIEEKYWDADKRVITSKHPQAARLINQINKKRQAIDDAVLEYTLRSKRLTIETLRAIVQGRPTGKSADSDFVEYAIETVEERYKLGKIGVSVRDNALCGFNKFRKFLSETYGEDSIFVSELTVELVKKYIFWRQRQGNINSTINKALTPIMRTAKRAVIDKLLDASIAEAICDLYLPTKKELGEDDGDEVHYLTEEQMKQFVGLRDKVKYPRTKDFMDMFLFSLNACGLRISDLITLEWRNVDFAKKSLRKILYKGDKAHEIPLNDNAIHILERWQDRTGEHRFVFGLLDDDFDLQDKEERKRMRLNKNRAIITSLRTLGDKMELPFNLTMHVARHTFAVWALNKGVDVHVISRLMGHSSVMVTEKVYAKFMPDTLKKEVQSKLNFNLFS